MYSTPSSIQRSSGGRRGLATAAVKLVADWALEDVGLHRLAVKHSVKNAPSWQLRETPGSAWREQLAVRYFTLTGGMTSMFTREDCR